MNENTHICDENGCRENATSMVKLGMAYGLYCDGHAEKHQAAAVAYREKTNRGALDSHLRTVRRGR